MLRSIFLPSYWRKKLIETDAVAIAATNHRLASVELRRALRKLDCVVVQAVTPAKDGDDV